MRKTDTDRVPEGVIEENIPVIEAVASGIASGSKMPSGVVFNDLVSWGVEGLIKAYHNYKDDKGTQFKTYAYYRIKGEILDRIRREWSYRNPIDYRHQQDRIKDRIAEVTEEALQDFEGERMTDPDREEKVNDLISNSAMMYLMSVDDVDVVSNTVGTQDPAIEVIDEVERSHDRNILWEEIRHLDNLEKKILQMFYIQGLKQIEIADALNLSRSKVCRLHMKVLEKLRRRLSKRMG